MNDLLRRVLFLPEQASSISTRIDGLHYFVIITTMISSTAVGLAALLFFVRYRARRPGARTVEVRSPWWFEVLCVTVPLGFFLWWAVIGFRQYLRIATPPADAMDVYVSAKQWMWEFAHPKGPNAIGTLHVPVGRPVRLLMTSRDVIHSFYVPQFRIKQDVLPGRYTQTWFEVVRPGRYPIFCTEYCGTSHSMMRGEVVALPGDEFDRWLAERRMGVAATQDAGSRNAHFSDLVSEGQRLAVAHGCATCHSVDGTPHIGPTWRGLYRRQERLTDGRTIAADEAYLTESMMDPRAKIVVGFDPVMPPFQGRLTPPETAALIEFIKSLRGGRIGPLPTRGLTDAPIAETTR